MYDVAIIGCGIAGAAIAYELSKKVINVAIFDKENDVSNFTSKANSGILHSGYDPAPGTLMAKFNIQGSKDAEEICGALDVPYKKCGSLILAFTKEEEEKLKILFDKGKINGVEYMEIWDRKEILAKEQNVSEHVLSALYAPSAAIVSPWEYTIALAETAIRNGAELYLNSEVKDIERAERGYCLKTNKGDYYAKYIVNAAGVWADKIHNMVSAPKFQIIPDKGEYYLFDNYEGDMVSRIIFQCPNAKGKGALVAPTVQGNLIVGPNNETPKHREDRSVTSKGLKEVKTAALRAVPKLNFAMNIRSFSGIRSASDRDDFIIEQASDAPGFIDVAGIKSPGLTAAPAIAKYVVGILTEAGLEMKKKSFVVDTKRNRRFKDLSIEQKKELIKTNPKYGKIICRCETVTEGEVIEAIQSPIPIHSMDYIKKRCMAGMGRCQGSFCGSRIIELMSSELNLSPTQINQDKPGSNLLFSHDEAGESDEG